MLFSELVKRHKPTKIYKLSMGSHQYFCVFAETKLFQCYLEDISLFLCKIKFTSSESMETNNNSNVFHTQNLLTPTFRGDKPLFIKEIIDVIFFTL